MMLDHIGIPVRDYERSKAFYLRALEPLGARLAMEGPPGAGGGIGRDGTPVLWLAPAGSAGPAVHVAFNVRSRSEVDAFHRAAIAAGGRDNGAPGLRPHYHPNYYAAYVHDPDGHNVEAVCHEPG